MTEFNTYPVFVADQVLTADQLNEIVNYLDQQERLTRNKLIGIGIVCGMELSVAADSITMSEGCGVTSEGYLIVEPETKFTHYHPYDLPEYFSTEYKAMYDNWHKWELLTAQQSLQFDDAVSLKDNAGFTKDKVVVLLLEMTEKPLKNCTDTNCDDKGESIEFNIKPLLVNATDLDKVINTIDVQPLSGNGLMITTDKYKNLQLKRFNVPVKDLTNTDAVLNAFLQIVDETTLANIAGALNYYHDRYQLILGMTDNPFDTILDTFKETLNQIKTTNPFFIQYFYDWMDDIVKACRELSNMLFEVQAVCCPDEGLFPIHLTLGEADRDTTADMRDQYRSYFIYSPLFNEQRERLDELKLLYRRLVDITANYEVPDPGTFQNELVKITPGKIFDYPLSERCIPYYYNLLNVYKSWSWEKTRKGDADQNLSYGAANYSDSDQVIEPLLYDIEPYNFYRIEGHIGKPYNQALTAVVNQRDQYNVPFEAVALSTATISAAFNAADYACQFNDLDSIFKVLIAELQCKLGDFECMASGVPYKIVLTEVISSGLFKSSSTGTGTDVINTGQPDPNASTAPKSNIIFNPGIGLTTLKNPDYIRGDFLKSHCAPAQDTIGAAYLNAVKSGYFFTKPSTVTRDVKSFAAVGNAGSNVPNLIYNYLFYFIDSAENAFAVALNKTLEDIDIAAFTARYKTLIDVVSELAKIGELLEELDPNNQTYTALLQNLKNIGFYDFAVQIHVLLHACLDERLSALKDEYNKRVQELSLLTNFMNYFKNHPGIEHKAGVTRGGTFVLVYHETPPLRLINPAIFSSTLVAKLPGAVTAVTSGSTTEATNLNNLIETSYVKDPQLLKNFQVALGKFLDTCKDMDPETKNQITQVLVRIPQAPALVKFRIPEQSVVADFYIPYICCSDCPPVSYVVPKAPTGVLSISMKPTEFCNDDTKIYPVHVSPQGGQLTASTGGVQAGTFNFSPGGLKAGKDTLTYKLPDGRSTSIDVLISQSFEINFKYKVAKDGVTVTFLPGSADYKESLWDFGDNSTSNESSPVHTYQFDGQEQTFAVSLTVTDAPCTAEAKQTISLTKPVPARFSLFSGAFCSNDQKAYEFTISPFPDNISQITNKDGLAMNLDAANKQLTFVPANQKIKATKDFHLAYKGLNVALRVIVADASFFMAITQNANDYDLALRAKQTDATAYEWLITQGNTAPKFKGQKVSLSLAENKLKPGALTIIALTVIYKTASGNCTDSKRFALNEGIFYAHVGKGEFDNTTKK